MRVVSPTGVNDSEASDCRGEPRRGLGVVDMVVGLWAPLVGCHVDVMELTL